MSTPGPDRYQELATVQVQHEGFRVLVLVFLGRHLVLVLVLLMASASAPGLGLGSGLGYPPFEQQRWEARQRDAIVGVANYED